MKPRVGTAASLYLKMLGSSTVISWRSFLPPCAQGSENKQHVSFTPVSAGVQLLCHCSAALGRGSGAQVYEQGCWGVPLGMPWEKLSNCIFCLGTLQASSMVIMQAGKKSGDVKGG